MRSETSNQSKNISDMKSSIACLILLAALSARSEAAQYRRTGSDGREYLIVTDNSANWYEAQHRCQQQHMQLLQIKSAQKNNIVLAILRDFAKPMSLWLDANDEYNRAKDLKRNFYLSTSGERMTFSYLSKDNPHNDRGQEHCVQIWKYGSDPNGYRWNDNLCTKKFGYICEENFRTTADRIEMQKKEQVTKQENTKLSDDFKNTQNVLQKINTNTRIETDMLLYKSEISVDEEVADFKRSFFALIQQKPYTEAVIADIGAPIRKLITEKQANIRKISEQTRASVKEVHLSAEKSSNVVMAQFAQKLEYN